MADKLTYIPNKDTQNFPFRKLHFENETFGHSTTNQNSIKVPIWGLLQLTAQCYLIFLRVFNGDG